MMQNSCAIQSSLLDLFSYVCQPPVQKFHHLLKFKQQSKHFPQLKSDLVRIFIHISIQFLFQDRDIIHPHLHLTLSDGRHKGREQPQSINQLPCNYPRNHPNQSINYRVIIQETTLTSINYHVIFSGIPQAINQLPCNYLWNNPSQSIHYRVIIQGTTLVNQSITV